MTTSAPTWAREPRRLWSTRPSLPLLLVSTGDIGVVILLASRGWLMAPAASSGSRGAAPRPQQRLPIVVVGRQVGTAVLRLPQAGQTSPDVQFRDAVNRALLVTGAAAAALAVPLGVLLSRRATVPVRRLTAATEAWRRGERGRRVGYASPDEFGVMAASFDRMAGSVEEQERLRRVFAADVAHELPTPLMVLRSQVEAMQDGVMDCDDDALASLQEEVARVGRLAADLEILSSADAARFTLRTAAVDLGRLAADAVDEFRAAFSDRRLVLDASDSLTVHGDAVHLRQVPVNLLTNALRFTPEGGTVRVRLSASGEVGVLEVSDTGPGIPADELPRVFDRFFRGSRSQGDGSGIGLAVVRELVAAHGGEVSAANVPGGGARFTVRLPTAGGADARAGQAGAAASAGTQSPDATIDVASTRQ